MSKNAWIAVSVVGIVIVVLAVVLVVAPGKPRETPPFTSENVKVQLPRPNGNVVHNFTVTGEARGTWFFEASFPVQVRDPQNIVVGQGIAQANGEWMTEDFVPFTAPVVVKDYTGPATLVLIKDNPSGLPEHDDSVEFPINVLETK